MTTIMMMIMMMMAMVMMMLMLAVTVLDKFGGITGLESQAKHYWMPAALLLAGQGARLSSDAKEIEAETAEIQAQTPRAGALQGLETNRRRLAAYRQVEERTSPLSAAGAAIGIVAIQDLTPLALGGLLRRDIGGRPVYPHQPEGLWKEFSSIED